MTISCWLDQAYAPRSALSGHFTADAAVIGAGMTGVALAWFLQQAGLRVLLVEAHSVAGGATGRNAGFVTSGLGEHYSGSVAFWGRGDAAAISKLHLKNHEIVASLVEQHDLKCGYGRTGSMAVAVDAEEEVVLRESHSLLREDKFSCELLEANEVNRALSGRGFRCGLFNPSDGHINPARFARDMARIVEANGVHIFEDSPIESLHRSGNAWILSAPAGIVSAPLVFMACNAWVPLLCPQIPIQPVHGVTQHSLHVLLQRYCGSHLEHQ